MVLVFKDQCLQLYNSIPRALFTVDNNRVITSINKKTTQLMGYSAEEMVGRKCSEFCFGPCAERCKLFDESVPKPIEDCEGIIKRYDGQMRIVSKNIDLLRNEKGEIIGGIETFEDITESKKTEEALKETEERYRTLYENTSSPVLVTDLSGNYVDCNLAACRFFECTKEELTSMNVVDVIPHNLEESPVAIKRKLKKEGIAEAQFLIRGRIKVLELIITPTVWRGKKVIVGVGKDITERKQAEARILHMAYHDALTGFPNRVFFKEKLAAAMNQARHEGSKLSVLFLDLDRFKIVNDTLGHDCGDTLLRGVAERLKSCLQPDDVVARLSGDEFIILSKGAQRPSEVLKVAQKIIRAIKDPFVLADREFHITVSIGAAIFPDDGSNEVNLIKNADTAMYRAKELGGDNCCLYEPNMNEKVTAKLELENSLRGALERGEFILEYQPQVESNTGNIVGVEALIRWNHPRLGVVQPMEFIPIAEETGLIIPIGDWVLERACQQSIEWQQRGLPSIRVAVNISARQFQQGDLASKVARLLKKTGLSPEFLELEITESTAMQNLNHTIKVVRKLKKLGVGISIDDFGTGYASLSYLKFFPPIDTLKIDRSFVMDIPGTGDSASVALVSTMITLAKNLKLKVVAEGVENNEQLRFLCQQQCDHIQGFLFSKPINAQKFELLLKQQPFRKNKEGEDVGLCRMQ